MTPNNIASERLGIWVVVLAAVCADGCNRDLNLGLDGPDRGGKFDGGTGGSGGRLADAGLGVGGGGGVVSDSGVGGAGGVGGTGGTTPVPGTSAFVVFDAVEREGGQFPVGVTSRPAVGNWDSVSQVGNVTQQVFAPINPPRGASRWALRFGGDTQSATVLMATWAVSVSGEASGASGGSTGGGVGGTGGASGASRYQLDFSAYVGFSFWARSSGANSTFVFAVSDNDASPFRTFFLTESTTDAWPSVKLTASTEWQHYTVLFEDLRRSDARVATVPLGAGHTTGVHFVTGHGTPAVELWIDDIVLLCREKC